jgi:Peptidase M10 serralysin C terminal
LDNAGTINGGITFNGGADSVVNSGVINGSVSLLGGEFDSTLGSIDGSISMGSDGGVAIGGQTGGSIYSGSGNDVLYANPTQTAANDAAQTILDGGAGDNWLYGDGAYTTFDSGDNSSGTYNQIFGGASQMAGVSGYTNNTVDYANLSSAYNSVDVNLLNGDAYMCRISKASGAPTSDLTFEDYLKNVPNVIGSSGSDVIICDNGVDTITHGSGAGDVLYAGAGAGSQDTFAYTALSESPLSNHDIIEGFKVGIDKLDFSQLDLPIADFLLSYGGSGSNSVYVEKTPSTGFHSATDMIISVQASTSTALTYKDLII